MLSDSFKIDSAEENQRGCEVEGFGLYPVPQDGRNAVQVLDAVTAGVAVSPVSRAAPGPIIHHINTAKLNQRLVCLRINFALALFDIAAAARKAASVFRFSWPSLAGRMHRNHCRRPFRQCWSALQSSRSFLRRKAGFSASLAELLVQPTVAANDVQHYLGPPETHS
jgi:hypothetical protein